MIRKFQQLAAWLEDRTGVVAQIQPLMKHPVPPHYLWSYVFGSATLFCFLLQLVTGVALSWFYEPSSESAYDSLLYIHEEAPMGHLLRSIHYYGASAMILLIGIHMIRVYLTASYKFPREMNWISGVVLLLCTIFMGFTGQLLRWDSNGVWSSVVAAEQLGRIPLIGKQLSYLLIGGTTIGGQSLSRFYSYHVFLFPAIIMLVTGFHLYLVLRNGISEPPKAGRKVDPGTYREWYQKYLKEKGVPFWPHAAWHDVLFGALVILSITALAVFIGAPALTGPPDPSQIHTSPRPDWFMVPFFALFALMPYRLESAAMVIGPLVTLALLFAIPFISHKGERSPLRRPWAIFGVVSVVLFAGGLLYVGIQAPWSADFDAVPLPVKATPVAASDSSLVRGVHLFYEKGCEYCHRINGYGGKSGPELSLVGRRLSERQLSIRIVNGAAAMPAYGSLLTKEELETLVHFLSTMH